MTVVIDAKVAVAACYPLPYSQAAEQGFLAWRRAAVSIYSPSLWWYEATSAVRKLIASHQISEEDGTDLLGSLDKLGILSVEAGPLLARASLEWAQRLGHHAAYDAAYLACAEMLEAPLFSGDKRLLRRAGDLGLDWVRAIETAD